MVKTVKMIKDEFTFETNDVSCDAKVSASFHLWKIVCTYNALRVHYTT